MTDARREEKFCKESNRRTCYKRKARGRLDSNSTKSNSTTRREIGIWRGLGRTGDRVRKKGRKRKESSTVKVKNVLVQRESVGQTDKFEENS